MMWLLLVLLVSLAVGACAVLGRIVRACNKRLLLAGAHGIACDASQGIGISVVCSGVHDPEQVANLLAVEYARYEVVVVMDSRCHPAEFEALAARYRMIRVEWRATDELPVTGVRGLGRSRKRCYRRLVLMDRAQDAVSGDLNAATAVATYDYVLPLCAGVYLLPDAVTRLAAELGEHPAGELALIRTRVGEPACLVSREAVVAAGGFSRKLLRSIPRRRRRTLWEPLLRTPEPLRPTPRMPLVLLLAAAISAVAIAGWWAVAASLMTAALVWAAAACASQRVTAAVGVHGVRLFGGGWRSCKLSVKNFTIS